ncbi:MAG TPA: hypothetical protein VEZ20_10825 [Allosphingosinicella sp.]|nr:hypothetical protein [Allosphingosinicella sp.]
MRTYLIAALVAAAAIAAPAQAQGERWQHEESGISVPRSIGDMSLSQERDGSGGQKYDMVLQYGTSRTPVTLYVYRSAYPNAAIWFERTRLAMNANVGADVQSAAPRSFTLGGATAPNGLREEIALAGGQATGVAIAQVGEWIVKLRITSNEIGRAAIAERMDRLLEALRFANPAPATHPLTVPGPCADGHAMRGRQLRLNSRHRATAAAVSVLGYGDARGIGGLAAEPARWCRVTQTKLPVQLGSLYRRRDGNGWVALLGDSGRAAAAFLTELPGDSVRAVLFASLPASTHSVAAYDGVPDPEEAIPLAIPVVIGQARGIAEMGTEPADGPRRRRD